MTHDLELRIDLARAKTNHHDKSTSWRVILFERYHRNTHKDTHTHGRPSALSGPLALNYVQNFMSPIDFTIGL